MTGKRARTGAEREADRIDWRRYAPALLLTAIFSLAFLWMVGLLNIALAQSGHLPRVAAADVGNGSLAALGAAMTYRGFGLLAIAIAIILLASALILVDLVLTGKRNRAAVEFTLMVGFAAAIFITLQRPSVIVDILRHISGCTDGLPYLGWNFCSLVQPSVHRPFPLSINLIVDAASSGAMVATTFAILAICRAPPNPRLPAVLGSADRCVTLLLAGASMMLIADLLGHKALVRWALAPLLASSEVPPDLAAYVAGATLFRGALDTAFLAIAWFMAVILLNRHRGAGSAGEREAKKDGGFSIYNFSAILGPALSSIAANLLSG